LSQAVPGTGAHNGTKTGVTRLPASENETRLVRHVGQLLIEYCEV
jgi:hypothetical protein